MQTLAIFTIESGEIIRVLLSDTINYISSFPFRGNMAEISTNIIYEFKITLNDINYYDKKIIAFNIELQVS